MDAQPPLPAAAPEKEEHQEPEKIPEGFSDWIKMAEAPQESAPFHRGDLPAANNTYGKYYIPRILGPDDPPLPEMPWDNTGPAPGAKKQIEAIIDWLWKEPSHVHVIYCEAMPKKDALAGYYNKAYNLKTNTPWEIFDDLRHLVRGDIIEMAGHEWNLLVRTKPWHNLYNDPAKRKEYWQIREEAEKKFEEHHSAGLSNKARLLRLEMWFSKTDSLAKTCETQRQAISIMLMMHTKYKQNQEMVGYLRENVASQEHDRIVIWNKLEDMRVQVNALKELYGTLLRTVLGKHVEDKLDKGPPVP